MRTIQYSSCNLSSKGDISETTNRLQRLGEIEFDLTSMRKVFYHIERKNEVGAIFSLIIIIIIFIMIIINMISMTMNAGESFKESI